jgi:hypothetical protein
MAQF